MLVPFRAASLAEAPGIAHGFFTRAGGVSTGLYESLNCGFGSHDTHGAVAENRRRVARSLSAGGDKVLTVHQCHSAHAIVADATTLGQAPPKADGIATATRGLVIGALAADCAPVLFADAQAGVIGAAHAGWRGALGGIVEATIAAMEILGAQRQRIRAVVGPCINQPHYEVGPEFAAEFLTRDRGHAVFFSDGPSGRPHFDLPAFVASIATRAGVGTVERQTSCTYENESLFFSYRRASHRKESDYGRQISAIVLI